MNKKIIIISILLIIGIIFYSTSFNVEINNKMDTNKMIAYVNGKRTGDIPSKNDGYVVDKIECTNDATATWNDQEWGILITDLSESDTKCSVYFITPRVYKDNSGASYPELYDGLIPVKYNSNGDTVVADLYEEWYDYDDQEWANAVLVKSTARNKEAGETLSQSEILQYYVWIPRYRYKLWNTGGEYTEPQMIDIRFENNKTAKSNGTTNGSWLTAPAFTFGNTELNGFWFGKFETTGNVSTSSNPTNLTILPGVGIYQSNNARKSMFEAFRNQDILYADSYGLNSNEIDVHLIKNIDWGAVSYLTSSKYGKYNSDGTCINDCQVWKNPQNRTGCASSGPTTLANVCNAWNTTIGGYASTTDNTYGVFDMSGASWEAVMAYCNTSTPYAFSTSWPAVETRYYDAYSVCSGLGDATKEILKSNTQGWYSSYIASSLNDSFFSRGGRGDLNGIYGICNSDRSGNVGGACAVQGYRAIITEQDGSYNGNGYS